jgi:CHAT domain-containing protein
LSTAHDAFKALDQGNASLRVALGQLYLETGRYDKAEKKLRGAVEKLAETRGQEDPRTTTARTYLAQALANQGKINEAVSQYIQAMDDVNAFLGNRRVYSQQSRTEQEHNVQQMLLGYLDLMVQAHQARADIDVDPVAEGFVIADSIRSRALQAALLGMSARAAAGNEFLADLVRKEQDLKVKLGMLEEKTIDTIENFHGGEQNKKLQQLARKRKKITKALEKIHERLAYEYPEYSQLMNPVPVSTRDMQSFLADDEVMLSYSVQDNRTILWALTKQQAQMYVIDMGRNALTEKIQFLRRSLEAEASSIADIPSFPVGTAHLLYSRLVQPAAALMQGKKYLVIVPHGPLMSLPFGALVTQQTRQPRATPGSLPFSEYRDVPWLALDYAISQVPSATALHTLRKYAKPAEADLPFVGYGNPAFRGVAESDLGIRGFLKRASANSWNVRELPPLPDTADEIRGIAKTLGADDSDIFLGTRANEENVKGTSLNEYKVIAFATHGLVSGELDGLKQPALALTPPEHMQAGNDGLLEMGEVLGLKLDADWVVLSACNTAAADGSLHGEGLSGLAQAFFYAGSRALLVSLWPVESSSTRLLTTTLFAVDKKNGGVSRAQALAQARQRLIKGRGFVKDGKEQFTYAHPMFWAAFIVVGEGAK